MKKAINSEDENKRRVKFINSAGRVKFRESAGTKKKKILSVK